MCRFLRQHARGQLPSGAMQSKYPGSKSSHISTWTLTYVVSLREYVRHTGDRALAVELWPTVRRILGWLESYRLAEGVYGNLPLEVTAETNIYNFADWAPVDTRGANAAWNAHAYHCLTAAAVVAELAGDRTAAKSCLERAATLRASFQKIFWDEARGVFINGLHEGRQLPRWGCQENFLAVLFGLANDRQRNLILQRLKTENLSAFFVPDPKDYDEIIPGVDGNAMVAIALNRYRWPADKMVPVGTPYFAGFALQALGELGLMPEALDLIRQRWGEFSRQGGTTIWETWQQETGSLSHGWGCAPVFILGKYILGVAPSDDPAVDYLILPQRGDLTWACGRVPTPHGVIEVSWQYDGRWHLEVIVPPHCRVVAGLPTGDISLNGQRVPSPRSITRAGMEYRVVEVAGEVNRLEG
jgi:alpha-L-rhamnosidase